MRPYLISDQKNFSYFLTYKSLRYFLLSFKLILVQEKFKIGFQDSDHDGHLGFPMEMILAISLRKHAYSNILNISPPKNENFQIKKSDRFYISAENIACGYSLELPRRGSSNRYPQSMFLSRNKK